MRRVDGSRSVITRAACLLTLLAGPPLPAGAAPPLRLFWVDVEGGAATLLVTPAGESVLIDAGNPGGRDAARIHRVVTQAAGLSRIDHFVLTHFHADHFGGLAELAALMPVGTVHERDLASAPERERAQPPLEAYQKAAVARRARLAPAGRLPLKQAQGAAAVALEVLGANGQFASRPGASPNAAACAASSTKGPDESDNRNSVVTRLSLGRFDFFDGGDLTWEAEATLACPDDRTGAPYDVAQIDHHGLDTSNNPVLLRTLRPSVVVVNNGPRKGNEPGTFATLEGLRLHAIYQVHRNLRSPESNVEAERIANEDEDCAAHFIRLTVDPDGRRYEVWVPSTGHRRSYLSR